MSKKEMVLGTRGSRLALCQAEEVRTMLVDKIPGIEARIQIIKTEGDLDRSSPLTAFGGRGAFVKSIESSLLAGRIDAAVHSLKDLPSRLPEGLVLGAVPVREDPRDVLVTGNGCDFFSLQPGSTVGTGSERRRSQILDLRPDICCKGIRGNVETRLRKCDEGAFDAVILAAAGMSRLGLLSRVSQYFEPDMVLPAPCQGAIGVECREDDSDTREVLEQINDPGIRACVDTERTFIALLGMGCHTPVGAFAKTRGEDIIFRAYVHYGDHGGTLRSTIHTVKKNARNEACELAREFRKKIDRDNP